MSAAQVMAHLRERGIEINLSNGGLRLKGAYGNAERSMVRKFRSELIWVLEQGRRLPTPTEPDWATMRTLAASLGQQVTDGKRNYLLWGISPHGAICHDGKVLVMFSPQDLSPSNSP